MKGNAFRRRLILRDSRQTSPLFPPDGIEFAKILASASAAVSGMTVGSRWDVIPVFFDLLTIFEAGRGRKGREGEPEANHTGELACGFLSSSLTSEVSYSQNCWC